MKTSIKDKLRRKKAPEPTPARITNDTLAEHRERVISGGRRYKYPIQYAKHKIIINTIVISVIALVGLGVFGWWQLYIVKNSSDFFYRVTQILPLPVANVNGQNADFSDFLLNYRASQYYLAKYDDLSLDSQGGKLQLQYKEQDALNLAISDAYAKKIASEHSLRVTDNEVNKVLDNLRSATNGQLTQQTSEASSQRILGMSASDLRTTIYNSILRAKASFAVDTTARETADTAKALLAATPDFTKVAAELNAKRPGSAVSGASGDVASSALFGGLRASEVAKLDPNKVSGPLMSVTDDGYYFVSGIKNSGGQVSFSFLRIPLAQFKDNIKTLDAQGKIHRYISIKIDKNVKQ